MSLNKEICERCCYSSTHMFPEYIRYTFEKRLRRGVCGRDRAYSLRSKRPPPDCMYAVEQLVCMEKPRCR